MPTGQGLWGRRQWRRPSQASRSIEAYRSTMERPLNVRDRRTFDDAEWLWTSWNIDPEVTRMVHSSQEPPVDVAERRPGHRERGAEGASVIQSVDRAVRVLTALQSARRMTLSELAARLELPPSTVHGLVKTLVGHGLVVQERRSGRYQLGPAVLLLGNVYLDTLELRSKAIPWAEDLAARTGSSVRTAVLLLEDVVVIHHQPRPDGSRQMAEVGIMIPAHASAWGKAILAFDDDAADRVLRQGSLRSMTGETVTSPAALRGQLDEVRDGGLAIEQDEAVLGESAVAAPIFDSTGTVVGAIGLVEPSRGRAFPAASRTGVRDAARAISRELGATTWPVRPPPR
jgi:DNA-binding IclR family transcriptional regulator